MTRIYSVDFRERVVEARRAGVPAREISQLLQVSLCTIYRWDARVRSGESLVPRPKPGRPRRLGPELAPQLTAQVAQYPDATLAEHCDLLATATGLTVGLSTMGRALNGLGLRRKKRV